MLRKVPLILGVTHTSHDVEICYVDIHRTTGHSHLSIR